MGALVGHVKKPDVMQIAETPWAAPCVDGCIGWSWQHVGSDVDSSLQIAGTLCDKACPLSINTVWIEGRQTGLFWSESFSHHLDFFSTLDLPESSLFGFCLLLGICLMFTCWLGKCCDLKVRLGNQKRKRLKSRQTWRKKGKQMSHVVRPGGPNRHEGALAWAGRKVGQQRVKKPRLKHRYCAQILRVRYFKAWLLGRSPCAQKKALGKRAQTRNGARQSLGLYRGVDLNQFEDNLNLDDRSVFQISRSFRGGAAGAAKTNRKRQESLLLSGLRDLLLQVGQGDEEEVSEQTNLHRSASPSRGRGRGRVRSRSPQRSRSPSPGWVVKGKGKRQRKSTDPTKPPVTGDITKPVDRKGKGGSAVSAPKKVQFSEKPQSQAGEATLLAQLKALVLEADTHGCHDLVPRLGRLVQTFTKETAQRSAPQLTKVQTDPRPRNQKQSVLRIDKSWWAQGLVPLKKVCEALDAGEEPPGDITLASFEQIMSMQALAKTHNVSKSLAVVCSDEPDHKLASENAGEVKWVLFEGNRWKQVWVFPLISQLPAWPSVP